MRATLGKLAVVAAGLIAASFVTTGPAQAQASDPGQVAQTVCYAWNIFPNSPLRLRVGQLYRLTTADEIEKFGHPLQGVAAVHGKGAGPCSPTDTTMATAVGTVIIARDEGIDGAPFGAHLGLEVHAVRGDAVGEFCRPYQLDCTSREVSTTPQQWFCQSRNEWDVFHGESILTLVDPLSDQGCSVFEDGAPVDGGNGPLADGPAPGRPN
jgi:hypothetical protein